VTKTTEEMIEVMQAFIDGKKIEWSDKDEPDRWYSSSVPSWNFGFTNFRVAEEPRIPDSIDWSHVADEYICHAVDENEVGCLFTKTPMEDTSCFDSSGVWVYPDDNVECLDSMRSHVFSSFKRGNLPWDQSLIYRPGHEPKEDVE